VSEITLLVAILVYLVHRCQITVYKKYIIQTTIILLLFT